MIKKLFFLGFAIILFSGCEVTKSIQSAINLKNCNYTYNSIADVAIADIKKEDINLSNPLSALQVGKIITLLNNGNGASIPFSFNLKLNVQNPNTQEAAFENMKYIISIDDVEFVQGELSQPFSVQGGQTQPLSIHIALDIGKIIQQDSKSAIINIVKNFIGINDQATKITVQLKPTIKIGNTPFSVPNYIPIHFTFGGKQ